MIVTESAIHFIKLQRSNYDKKNIIKKFNEDLAKEFNSIIDFLPDKCESVLDIGCGLAGISVQLHHYYDNPELYLVDKNQTSDKVKYGFSEEESFYNSFDVLQEIMIFNNVENYKFVDPENDFSNIKNIDVIISLLACGFHFPLYYYLGRIFQSISKNGIFICDIRKGKEDQIKLLNLYFRKVEEIKTDNPKTIRMCAREAVCLE